MLPVGKLLNRVFEKVSDDRDVIFHRQQQIFFKTPAVGGYREQDPEFCGVHHLSDDQGADL